MGPSATRPSRRATRSDRPSPVQAPLPPQDRVETTAPPLPPAPRAARWIPHAILAVGLLATAFSTALIWRAGELRDRLTFLHATDIELQTIEDQFRTYTALLRGGAGLFAANDDTVTLAQFRAGDHVAQDPGPMAPHFHAETGETHAHEHSHDHAHTH